MININYNLLELLRRMFFWQLQGPSSWSLSWEHTDMKHSQLLLFDFEQTSVYTHNFHQKFGDISNRWPGFFESER